MCAKGKGHAKLQKKETHTYISCLTQENMDVRMGAASFYLCHAAAGFSETGSSCEAESEGGRLAAPAPERGRRTWKAHVLRVMVRVNAVKGCKQDYSHG